MATMDEINARAAARRAAGKVTLSPRDRAREWLALAEEQYKLNNDQAAAAAATIGLLTLEIAKTPS